MNMWEVLNLEQTADESIIKKAYRVKLRQHHPEEDPEGFKLVREAYENILQWLKNGAEESAQQEQVQTAEAKEPAEVHPHTEAFNQLLQDPTKRMVLANWKAWTETSQMLQIDEQQKISDDAITVVLANRWLPPSIIDVLWDGLSWNLLLNGEQQQVELGEFLDEWRELPLSISLDELVEFSAPEQRAILSFLRPLHIALARGQLDALEYHLQQSLTFVLPDLLNVKISVLKSLVALKIKSSVVSDALVTELIQLPAENLTVAQWETVAGTANLTGNEKAIDSVTEKLLSLDACAEAAELQYSAALKHDKLLAMSLACLRQRWNPLPPVYWRNERQLFPAPESSSEELMFNWLYGQLVSHNNGAISHRLDFVGAEGRTALIVKAIWAAHSGSWAWMSSLRQELIETLSLAETQSERVAMTLVLKCLQEEMQKQGGSETLQQKLAHYETDAFFSQEALTMEELSSLSKEDWLECVRRHPLLPDSWYRQLEQAEVLVVDEIREGSIYPFYIDSLCFYRSANPSYALSSVWQNSPFESVFDWMLFFVSHLGTGGLPKQSIVDALPTLPEAQQEGPISLILPFAARPDEYLPESVESFSKYPDQFIYRLVVDRQVSLLVEKAKPEVLMEKAKARDFCATMALSRLLEKEHFDEAVVFWNLVAANVDSNPQFHLVVDWQQQSLMRLKEEKGLVKETYHYVKPEFLHAMITNNREWFAPPEEFEEHSPEDEAKDFHYPMCILLTQLHLGLEGDGYNMASLKVLADRRQKQTELQQDTTDVAVEYLDGMYRQKLEKDISEKGEKAATYSKTKLKFLSFAFFAAWVFVFPMTVMRGLEVSEETLGVMTIFLFITHSLLAWQVSRPIITKGNRKKYLFYSIFTLLAAMIFRSVFLAFINVITHYLTANGLNDLYSRGGWDRKVVARREINMRKVLGFRD
ncbi:DnaJ domain-containing protein [Grimontia sp. NTOU-MAR1]|uniref:DnaJ domain-containing protein n=1 Tax=Grimontia sp. NTOU-MAR1 TaxID=3111011 RepID=UPI002DBD46D9|nr:DnaJ domain-containing protein [Grimontia sp. NTOU-MAR1]WRW00315.1 DnaJ domain-containing protein [Grimontia sp. NTOU-MAR1]